MKRNLPNSVKLTENAHLSYKIGVDEIEGLSEAMQNAMLPVRNVLRSKAYWDETLDFSSLEYKRRDGFIPHSHNFGGVELSLHIPKCEAYEWQFLEFGECDDCNDEGTACRAEQDGECLSDVDGFLDAYLRIILKFEGFDEDGNLQFYMNACGGNGDAPYFRLQYLTDVFEVEFTCKSVAGVKRAAAKHVKALLKVIEGK